MKTFIDLLKKELVQNLGFGILALVYIIFVRLVTYVAIISSTLEDYARNSDIFGRNYVSNMVNSYIGPANGFHLFVVVTLGGLFALLICSYLHSRKTVDFYHGLPVKKTTVFGARYLVGIIYFVLAYGINTVLMVIATAYFGQLTTTAIRLALYSYISGIFGYTLIYSISVLAGLLTATIVTHIVMAGIFSFILPLVVVLKDSWYGIFYATYLSRLDAGLYNLSAPAYLLKNYLQSRLSQYLPMLILFSVIFTVLSFVVCKLRRGEATETALAFKKLVVPLRVFFSIVCGVSGAFIVNEMFNAEGVVVFSVSFILLTAISSAIIQIIFHFDFGSVLKEKRYLLLSVAIGAVMVIVSYSCIKSYNSYVPKQEKIKSAAFCIMQLADDENFIEHKDKNIAYYSAKPVETGYEWISSRDSIFDNMKITDAELASSIMAACAETNDSIKSESLDAEQAELKGYYTVDIKCSLKGGRTVYRRYRMDGEKYHDLLAQLVASDEYKEGFYNFLYDLDAQNMKSIFVDKTASFIENVDTLNIDAETAESLKAALIEDTKGLTLDEMTEISPIADIKFFAEEYKDRGYDFSYNTAAKMFVYPSYKNTIAVLEEQGIDMYTREEVIENIDRIEVEKTVWEEDTEKSVTYTDKEKIAELVPLLNPEQLIRLMGKSGWDYSGSTLVATVNKDGNLNYDFSNNFRVPDEDLPDFVKADFDF